MRRGPSSSTQDRVQRPKKVSRKTPAKAPGQKLVYELSQAFFELLLKHRTYYTSAVADEKIAPMQGHVLHYLAERPCTMRELAQAAMLEPSNQTGIIDKLEARGLVTRREASADRRSKIVTMTEEGMALRKRLYQRFSEPAPWMVALTPQDQKRLLDIVRSAIDYEKSIQPPSGKTPRPPVAPVAEAPPKSAKSQGKRTKK
jgi:DNA-binding MarR family transcriptional regulator